MPKKRAKIAIVEGIKEYLAKIGRKGGKARLTTMTPEQRKKQSRRAAAARWSKVKKEPAK
ncbi:MAG: hypothetical protein WBD45_11770 [Terriglobales bacterium]